MTIYDDPEDRCATPSRRRFFGNRSPKKQAEVRAADRRVRPAVAVGPHVTQ